MWNESREVSAKVVRLGEVISSEGSSATEIWIWESGAHTWSLTRWGWMRSSWVEGGQMARGTQARALGPLCSEASWGRRNQPRRAGGRGQWCRRKSSRCGNSEAVHRRHCKRKGWTPVSSTAERVSDHWLCMPVCVLGLSPLKLVNPWGQGLCLFYFIF